MSNDKTNAASDVIPAFNRRETSGEMLPLAVDFDESRRFLVGLRNATFLTVAGLILAAVLVHSARGWATFASELRKIDQAEAYASK